MSKGTGTETAKYSLAGLETNKPNFVQPAVNLIKVRGKLAWLPAWLPKRGWGISKWGYLRYESRGTSAGIKRGARAHRLVMERIVGRKLEPHEIVHHMDFDKLNCCGCNLLLTTGSFNPSSSLRDPITGEFLSPAAWQRRYGFSNRPGDETPDWVTQEFVQ